MLVGDERGDALLDVVSRRSPLTGAGRPEQPFDARVDAQEARNTTYIKGV